MIEFECKNCHEPIRLSDDKAGATGQCPHCQSPIKAPLKSTLSLHDDAFAQAFSEVYSAPTLAAPEDQNAVSMATKAASLAGAALNWFFGMVFLALFFMSGQDSIAAAFASLAIAALLLPPVYRRLTVFFKIEPSLKIKLISVFVLFATFMVMLSLGADEKLAEKKKMLDQQAEVKRQSDREESVQYLKANKASILGSSGKLMDQGKLDDAINAVKRFRDLGDPDIDAFAAKVELKSQAIAKEEKKARLLEALSTVKADDTKERARIYEQLAALAPENADYKKQAADLKSHVAKAEEKEQEEVAAATLKSLKQVMGLAWRYDTYTDQMTNKEAQTAKIDSTNTLSFDFPYSGSQRATLQIRKHPRWGSDVILEVEQGQFLCSSYDGCSVSVRFGNGKPQRFSAKEPGDNRTTAIFISDYNRFMTQMRKVDEVVIEASFYQEGSWPLSFSTSDLDWK
jgi:hypothetical protein